jgi:uncharacterized surface protein with fasciclin (FAS1) repeats
MKTRLAIVGFAVAAIALAGCSSSSDDSEASSPSPSAEESMAAGDTIVDVAAGNEDFETLVAAVGAAGLAETLSGDGPFTVFAPTDEAFAALGQETIDLLLLPSNKEALTGILTYHVLDTEVMSADIEPGAVETVNGATVEITTADGGVQVGGATVIQADVEASNGVIHAIDAVLLPPDFDPASLATS